VLDETQRNQGERKVKCVAKHGISRPLVSEAHISSNLEKRGSGLHEQGARLK
jgi:hypothetical protein